MKKTYLIKDYSSHLAEKLYEGLIVRNNRGITSLINQRVSEKEHLYFAHLCDSSLGINVQFKPKSYMNIKSLELKLIGKPESITNAREKLAELFENEIDSNEFQYNLGKERPVHKNSLNEERIAP